MACGKAYREQRVWRIDTSVRLSRIRPEQPGVACHVKAAFDEKWGGVAAVGRGVAASLYFPLFFPDTGGLASVATGGRRRTAVGRRSGCVVHPGRAIGRR